MTRRYFGTDGIRGRANSHPMTPDIAMRVGLAAGHAFVRGDHRHRVVIGKDTRLSGYMMEAALEAGFVASGMDVVLLGPVPTPAVGMLTRSLRADLGVMISASHNPYFDNGIKLFGPDGFKLSDAREAEIEALIDLPMADHYASADALGRARRLDDCRARYIEFAKTTFPKHLSLDGLKIVVDCANGAAHRTAPAVFWELGADIVTLGVEPDGFNINDGCGSTAPGATCRKVVETGADLGVCLDGDADRVVLVDEKGAIIDGDQTMALVTTSWARDGRLRGGGLVSTIMSNLGLERRLASDSLKLERTKVGDRYVVERMREKGFNVGGEQSGHIVLSDFTTTGDGVIAALQTLAVVVAAGRPASEVCRMFEPVPQVLKNARVSGGAALLANSAIKRAVAEAERRLGAYGRLVIRPSGTESMVRVMAEGDDADLVAEVVDALVDALTREAGRAAA